MNQPGDSTIELIHSVHEQGASHIVMLMRHSAREFAPDKHDLLNPLTDEGRDLATTMGTRLPKHLTVRGYSSPADRCIETADLVMSGHSAAGGSVMRNRVVEALGVFYVLDQMKMFMAMRAAGGIVNFLQTWFRGDIAEDILIPADLAAAILGRLIAEKLSTGAEQPQLDLLVSHDFTLFTVKDRLLKQHTEVHPEVNFLDGIAFFLKDGALFAQSHHGPAIAVNL